MKPKEMLELADRVSQFNFQQEIAATAEALRVFAYIEALRQEEGASVAVSCENPEGAGPDNNVVECCASWTGRAMQSYETERFSGASLREALKAAHDAMMSRPAP